MRSTTIQGVKYEFSLTVDRRMSANIPKGYRLVGNTDNGQFLIVDSVDGALFLSDGCIRLAPSIRVFFELSKHVEAIHSAPVPQLYIRAFRRMLDNEYPELAQDGFWTNILKRFESTD